MYPSRRKKWVFSSESKGNTGGAQWSRPRLQFCAIYEKIGIFNLAAREAGYRGQNEDGLSMWDEDEGLILWVNHNRPSIAILRSWAEQYDDGKIEVPEAVRRRVLTRLANRFDATVRDASLEVIRSNAATVRHLNDLALDNKLDAELSPILQHANNGVQNTVRALKDAMQRGEDAPAKKVGRLKMKQARKQLSAPPRASNVVVGEFREVADAAPA